MGSGSLNILEDYADLESESKDVSLEDTEHDEVLLWKAIYSVLVAVEQLTLLTKEGSIIRTNFLVFSGSAYLYAYLSCKPQKR